MLAVIGQFPNHISILAIVRVEVLDAGKRRVRNVGMISAKQITIVINDVSAVIQPPHSHVLLAIQ
jgi:hypothetical protein